MDWAREVVDRVEVPRDLVDRRRLVELTFAGDREVEVDDVATSDRDGGFTVSIPVVVDVRWSDPMLVTHEAPPGMRWLCASDESKSDAYAEHVFSPPLSAVPTGATIGPMAADMSPPEGASRRAGARTRGEESI